MNTNDSINYQSLFLKFDLNGIPLLVRNWGGNYATTPEYIKHKYPNTYLMGNTYQFSAPNCDIFLLKYDDSCTMVFNKTYDYIDSDACNDAVISNGFIYYSGYNKNSGTDTFYGFTLKTDLEGGNSTVPEINGILPVLTVASVLLVAVWARKKR